MRVVVIEHLSLDGVVQGPGRPDEDRRGGFRHGGWALVAQSSGDPAVGEAMGAVMGDDFSWLFGRRSYDDMLTHWNEVGGPFRDGLNGVTKYVVTSHAGSLRWPNTVALTGDAIEQVRDLRARPGGALVVMGSGELVRSLLPVGLVDEMLLMTHPVVLGTGTTLFGPGDTPLRMTVADSRTTSSGIVLTTYRPVSDR